MLPYLHLIFSVAFAGILYPFVGFSNSLVVFLSGFVFDIDHYFYYGLKKKDWSFIKAYFYCFPGTTVYEKHLDVLHIFHTIEFWILLVIGFLFDGVFVFIFLGWVSHILLDAIDLGRENRLDARGWSLSGWILRH